MYLVYYRYILMLLLLPLSVYLFILFTKKYKQYKLGKLGNRKTLSLFLNTSPILTNAKNYLFLLALFLIAIALLRPQWGLQKTKVTSKGLEMVIALDVSSSMLAEDLTPNRLNKAILEINKLLKQLSGDRVGLITFSGSSTPICPLTIDYGTLKMFLKTINNYQEALSGTNIINAYKTATNMFNLKTPTDKLVIIFTDGENHQGDLDYIKDHSSNNNIIVIPVAVGSTSGQPIPNIDQSGNRKGYKKDKSGKVIISHVDIDNLKEIATIGPYLIDTNSKTVISIIEDTKYYKRSKLFESRISVYTERYQIFLAIGLMFLFASYLIPTTKQSFK